MTLKYYEKENQMFEAVGFDKDLRVTEKDALKIIRKLCRHFKFAEPEVVFYGQRDSGAMFYDTCVIRLNHQPKISLLIHELCHFWQVRLGICRRWHTKKLIRLVKRMAKYVMKKNYWIGGVRRQ